MRRFSIAPLAMLALFACGDDNSCTPTQSVFVGAPPTPTPTPLPKLPIGALCGDAFDCESLLCLPATGCDPTTQSCATVCQ